MTHTPHELHEEFPERADRIHALKVSNAHFAHVAAGYHELNRLVHRMESGVEPADDAAMEEAKKRRLVLKDEIAAMLG